MPTAKDLFTLALDCRPEERLGFVAAACGSDDSLRREVESLLRAFAAADGFLPEPDVGPERPGATVDRYRLIGILGEGSFGTVWLAEQREPLRRRVALKIVRHGADSVRVAERFAVEQQSLALMDHPDIARVLDAGATPSGRPYLVMELVDGVPLLHYCERHRLGQRERLRLFERVCRAVHHAHQKGVVHGDLKPSNILVAERDGVPAPKVIDFGIAEVIGSDPTTVGGRAQLLGTPEYMAPEQFDGGRDIDTRADVHALGAVLYELATGVPPWDVDELLQAGCAEALQHLRTAEPPAPSASHRTSPRAPVEPPRIELDWIVRRAMARNRERRYPSAHDLAEDISRLLADQPVAAGPAGRSYRLRVFLRRNRLVATAAALLLASLVGGLAATTGALHRARTAEAATAVEADNARRAAERAGTVQQFLQDEMLGALALDAGLGIDVTVLTVLDRTARSLDDGRFDGVPQVAADVHRYVGGLYRQIGRLPAADTHLRRAVELRRGVGGVQAGAELVRDLTFLADCQLARCCYRDADATIAEALAGCGAAADDRPGADLLLLRGKLARSRGDLAAAAADFERVQDLLAQEAPPRPARLAAVLNNLAELAGACGDHELALERYRLCEQRYRDLFGEDSVAVARCRGNMALERMQLGDLDGAEQQLRAQLALYRQRLPAAHPISGVTLVNLAALLHARGDAAAAVDAAREALAVLRAVFGEEHDQLANAHNNLGGYLEESGAVEAGEAEYRAALRCYEATSGGSWATAATTCYNLGSLLRKRGAFAAAEVQLARAVAGRTDAFGKDDPAVVDPVYWLADVQRELGRLAEAEAGYRRAVAVLRTTDDRRRLGGALVALGTLQLRTGDAAAAATLREALKLRRASHGDDHWLVAYARAALGRALAAGGDRDAARALLACCEAIAPPPQLSRRRREVLQWLAEFHDLDGDPGPASALRRQLQAEEDR